MASPLVSCSRMEVETAVVVWQWNLHRMTVESAPV